MNDVRRAYPPATLKRLAQMNLFHLNLKCRARHGMTLGAGCVPMANIDSREGILDLLAGT